MGIFGNAFGWPHLIVILVIILLLFGAPRLPALARSLGQSMKIFRSEIKNPDTSASGDTASDSSTDSTGAAKPADAKSKPKP